MTQEKLPFSDADEKLTFSIVELTKADFQQIKGYLRDPDIRDVYLNSIENTATLIKTTAEEVLENLKLVRAEDALTENKG